MWFSSLVEISMKIMQAHRLGIIFLLIEVNFGGIASFATMDEIVDGIDLATPTPPRRGTGVTRENRSTCHVFQHLHPRDPIRIEINYHKGA